MALSTSKASTAAQASRSLVYRKREGVADTLGQDYEVDICVLLFLRASRLCSDFYLASNHGDAGAFDDAVMVYRLLDEDTYRTILLQAKHKKNAKVTPRSLTGPKNDFSLGKYFSSFLEVSGRWRTFAAADQTLELQDVVYVLYTNAAADLGAVAQDDVRDLGQLLLTGGSAVQISYERVKDALSAADPSQLEDFLGRLVLCYGQMGHADASSYLDEEIRLILDGRPGNVPQIRDRITQIVRSWWAQPTDTSYLTKDSALCPVDLQGTRMSLEQYDPSVAEAPHIQLLARRPEGEEEVLGKHLPEPVPYYVPRLLERKAFLEESFFSAVRKESAIVAVVGMGKQDLQRRLGNTLTVYTHEAVQELQSFATTLPEDGYHEVFSELLGEYDCNMYLLKFTRGEFLCVESRGGLNTVRCHVKDKVSDRIDSVWDTSYRNVIVEGLPGNGKSCLMTWVGGEVKAANPADWVLRVDLGRLSDKVQQRDFQSVDDIKDFLAEVCLAYKDPCCLEKALFSHALEATGNVTILLDAFDEISPDHTEKCLRLLQGLARSVKYKQMVVTSRPVTRRAVEDVLGTSAFSLRPFSEKEQKSFFTKYLSCAKIERDEVISTVIKSVGQCLEVPLLAFMAAEGLFGDEYYLQGDAYKVKAKVKLYDLFVERQIRRYMFGKQDLKMLESEKKRMFDLSKNTLIEDLMNLAVNTLLNVVERHRVGFRGGYEGLKDSKLGLVVCYGDKVDFIHRTFAEFFLGTWLARNFKGCRELLVEKLFTANFELVRESFDSFLYRECPLHTAVAEGDLPAVDRLLAEGLSVSSVDTGGRTPLHVAVMSSGSDSVVQNLLSDAGAVVGQKDDVLGWSALTYAEAVSNWDAVELLLGKGAFMEDLRLLKEERRAIEMLGETCKKGNVKLSLAILRIHKGLLSKGLDWRRSTVLHLAAESGSVPLVRALVDEGAGLDKLDRYGHTAACRAAEKGHVDVIHCLKQKGASMKAGELSPIEVAVAYEHGAIVDYLHYGRGDEGRETDTNSALIKAAIYNDDSRVMELLEKGVDIEHRDEYGRTALHWSSLRGSVNVVKVLLQSGAKGKGTNNRGETALMGASYNGHTETVQLLLSAGADVNMTNGGDTALMLASSNGHTETVQLILSAGADVNMTDYNRATALIRASRYGHTESIQLLLSAGADVNMADNNGDTALMRANCYDHTETVKLILCAGADVNMANNEGDTALMLASTGGHTETVQLILSAGADVNMTDYNRATALIRASRYGHTESIQLLLSAGADVNMADNNGSTALMLASFNGHTETVQLLLSAGADVNMADNKGDTALMLASFNGHTESVQLNLSAGADVNMADNKGDTALMLASFNGHTESVQLNLSAGADVNMADNNGRTALMLASFNGHTETVQLLLSAGADVNMTNEGYTALMLASSGGHTDVKQLLLSAGAVETDAEQDQTRWRLLRWIRSELSRSRNQESSE